ncbi:MAG: hypothetical protein WC872_01730 [Candidatus Absconditabacterales bacterium]
MAKKNLIIYFVLIFLILPGFLILSGCKSKNILNIKFDDFILKFNTAKNYLPLEFAKLESDLDINLIYAAKSDSIGTGVSSILVSKNNIQQNDSLKQTLNNNIDLISATITGTTMQKYKSLKFKCDNIIITGLFFNFQINQSDLKNYFTQSFFFKDNYLYIISFQTSNKSENSNFITAVKNIKCTK